MHPDGREVRLDELPLADEFRDAETVRAEEIELSVPDGRSVTTLVNATPIRSADGAVESVVVRVAFLDRCAQAMYERLPGSDLSMFEALAFLERAASLRRKPPE